MVKNPPEKGETWIRSLGWEDPLEEGIATYSSILAWRIPMDRGAWWATVHGVAKSQTRFRDEAQRTHCQCRGRGFDPWSWKVPQVRVATKPVCPNYWSPRVLQPALCDKRSHSNEKPVHCKAEQTPLSTTRESSHVAPKTQCSQN